MTNLIEQIKFADLGISSKLCVAIQSLGWDHPSPIQTKAIPAALTGQDLVGVAQTGTGKTGAFLIPCIDKLEVKQGLQALVLCPTRELAQQVCEDASALLARSGSKSAGRVAAIYGGVGYGPQITALESGVEIITATPGRFMDHMRKGLVNLNGLTTLIFDEADRMLDMGFRPQIEEKVFAVRGRLCSFLPQCPTVSTIWLLGLLKILPGLRSLNLARKLME